MIELLLSNSTIARDWVSVGPVTVDLGDEEARELRSRVFHIVANYVSEKSSIPREALEQTPMGRIDLPASRYQVAFVEWRPLRLEVDRVELLERLRPILVEYLRELCDREFAQRGEAQ